ncbi:MAG: DHA2 family efflux MFS transporter permease subunit [Deltaproteobacteria bacterium]|nr:DHA2 family efflux MFS transporter permease subunit [Deltaproteobacteria bacterium]
MSAPAATAAPSYFETGWTGGRNPWAIALVVTMATFMEVLDTSVANVSLPHIAGDLSVTSDESTWVLTSYLVSNAIILPISGWLATRFGRKRFYMTCVALFTVSSLLSGLAPSLGTLIFFRILQGLGGGGLAPSEQAILVDTFPPVKRGMAMAIYGMAVVLAPAIGPTLGGYITDHSSWRWIFFINVPVGLASLALSHRFVTDPPHLVRMRKEAGSIDYVGLGLVALTLAFLQYALDRGQEADWFHSTTIVICAVVSAVCLIAFILWEWREPNPVIDLRMFKNRTFTTSNVMMLVLGFSLYGTTVMLPLFEQQLLGYTAERAGLTLSPGGFMVMAMMPLVGFLMTRMSVRVLIGFGLTTLALALRYMSRHLYVGVDFHTVWMLRVYQMVGMAFLFVPINSAAYVGTSPEQSNAVSGMMNVSRNIGGSLGISFVTTLIARRSQFHQAELSSSTNLYNPAFADRWRSVARAFESVGSSSVDAAHQGLAVVYRQMQLQAAQLAYLDAIHMLAIAVACMLPLLLFVKSPRPGETTAAV